MTETVRKTDGRHLRQLETILDKPVLHRFVISNDLERKELEEGIWAVSTVQFLT